MANKRPKPEEIITKLSCRLPLAFTRASSTFHLHFEKARSFSTHFLRLSEVNVGLNLFHQQRTFFMTDVNAWLVQQVFDAPQEMFKPNVEDRRQTDDLGGLKQFETGRPGYVRANVTACPAEVESVYYHRSVADGVIPRPAEAAVTEPLTFNATSALSCRIQEVPRGAMHSFRYPHACISVSVSCKILDAMVALCVRSTKL